jgi:hypothetical protein
VVKRRLYDLSRHNLSRRGLQLIATYFAARPELRRKLLLVGCALAGLALNCLIALANFSTRDADFKVLYSAGKLVGSGRLYDLESVRASELERNAKAMPFPRIPAVALAFEPLSALPYPVARALWLCACIAALAGFVYLWPLTSRAWACVAICWSAPVALCLLLGQDSMWFLFFIALGLRLLMGGRDFWAGLAFSACIAKPHLALLLPVFLIARSKWKALLGIAAGGTASVSLSFVAAGKDWPQRLIAMVRVMELDPAADRMPNLRGLLSFLGGGVAAEVALGLVVVAAVWFLSRRHPLPTAGAIVLAGGLLLSHHAYVYDALLLLPALLLPFQAPHLEWMRKWAIFLLSPTPYLFLMTTVSIVGVFLAHVAITGYTVALIAVMVRRNQGEDGTTAGS